MSIILETTQVCDIPHEQETPAETTRTFTVSGKEYEIDLCGAHLLTMDAALASIIKNARTVVKTRTRKAARRTQRSRDEAAEIRAWWRTHPEASNRPYMERGRIPGDAKAHYRNRDAA